MWHNASVSVSLYMMLLVQHSYSTATVETHCMMPRWEDPTLTPEHKLSCIKQSEQRNKKKKKKRSIRASPPIRSNIDTAACSSYCSSCSSKIHFSPAEGIDAGHSHIISHSAPCHSTWNPHSAAYSRLRVLAMFNILPIQLPFAGR